MFFRYATAVAGDHTHISLFAGKDRDHLGCSGHFCLRTEEWIDLKKILLAGGQGRLYFESDGREILESCPIEPGQPLDPSFLDTDNRPK